jgi:hypothetical protein
MASPQVTSASYVSDGNGPAVASSSPPTDSNGHDGGGLPVEALHPSKPWHKRRPSQILFDSGDTETKGDLSRDLIIQSLFDCHFGV